MPLPVRRAYAGAAEACTLSSSLNNSATSFSITGTTTGWPNTATGPFYMVIDPGLSTEEKVLVGARSSGSLSSVTRGVDGTTAAAHDAGATCYPVLAAVDLNEANLLASTLTTKGDLLSTDGSDPKRVAVGSNNTRLVADSAQTSGIKWVADTQNTVIDAKGDLLVGSAADTVARLAVDTTDGAVLIADSTATNGVSWQPQNTGVRNLLYNGAMQVAQRATSATGLNGSGYYTVDRWEQGTSTGGTWTQSQESDGPTGSGFTKSLKMLCTTAQASLSAGSILYIRQSLEGQDCQSIRKGTSSAKQLTLSFWVKANVTGTYVATLIDDDNTREVGKTYTVSAANTWEFKTLTFPADTTGTLNNDNGRSLQAFFWLVAGSTYTSGTLQTTWGSITNANRAVGQVNLASAINNYWQVTGVQLNVGSVAAPFEFKSYGQELRECQRYYYRMQAQGGVYSRFAVGQVYTTNNSVNLVIFPVTMRTSPTALEQSGTASHYCVLNSAGNIVACSAVPVFNWANIYNAETVFTVASGLTAGNATVAATNNGTSAYLAWSAEL